MINTLLQQMLRRRPESRVTVCSGVNGAPQRTTLATIVLAGGESRTVPLSNMPLSPGLTNGLRIHTDAAPGDVLSKLVSRGGSQLPVVEMLDKDERGAFNAGGHPWDVEPGVTSTLLLFNGDSTPRKVNLRFGTPSGPWMRRFTLEPMETRAISINELVGMQEKDDSGLALPSNAQSGELGWQSDSTWVSGRLLQTSTALGMARSFSCSQWVYACAFTLSPTPSLTLYLNNTGNLSEIPDWAVYTGFHPPTTCSCANPSSGNTTLYDSWQSGSTSIATITSGGTSSASVWQGVGVGSTTSYFYGNNMFLGGGSLQCQASQPANVAPVITGVAPTDLQVGGATTLTISGAGFGSSPSVQVGGASSTQVTQASNTQITVTVVLPSYAGAGSHNVTVTAAAQVSPPKSVTARVPSYLLCIRDTTTVIANCVQTKVRFVTYQIEDDNNKDFVNDVNTREQFSNTPVSTCGNPISLGLSCTPTPGGVIPDSFTVGCNSVGGSCGFTATHQQWVWCPGGVRPT